jgi:predicted DNA-binding ArsR family transcriptional regulator
MSREEYITGSDREELVAEVSAAYKAGQKSMIKIGRKYNISSAIVRNMLYESGARIAKTPHDPNLAEQHRKIKQMYSDESVDVSQVANSLNIPYGTVYSVLFRYGMLRRTKKSSRAR